MTSQNELVLDFIMRGSSDPVCTRCLTAVTGISNEGRVRQLCRGLRDAGWIERAPGQCRSCGKRFPQVNFPLSHETLQIEEARQRPRADSGHEWYWEGHVQEALIKHLRNNGWIISSFADTASHKRGKDIVALSSTGQEMWVSVKGYPERRAGKRTSPSTQGRHWFSMAIFDMVQYRQENPSVALAVAFPGGFMTYVNYIKRVEWLKTATPFQVYWIDEHGKVTEG